TSEIEKLNKAGNTLKTNITMIITDLLVLELQKFRAATKDLLNTLIMQGVTKFLGVYVYGRQSFFKNESDEFTELFEFVDIHLTANKSYIVQFTMPYELSTNGIYSESMGEMVLCLKADNKVYPIINSFYQNKTANLTSSNKIVSTYRTNCIFKTPNTEADYKIAVFARKHKDLWLNVSYTNNTEGFETDFLDKAIFRDFTTKIIPTKYNNDRVFYKHSQALVYEILQ
ncbi:hypothetical protein, partial [Helicobacter pylori]|uniref:hypothetical protein n=1 Tax=Helicobacter pylori TaxID=210 RepID=UPI000FDDA315